jgi:hypothetical protein
MDWIEAALEAKDATKPCEACGENDWRKAPHHVPLFQVDENFTAANPADPFGQGIVAAPRMCGHCGLLRLHVIDQLKPSNN